LNPLRSASPTAIRLHFLNAYLGGRQIPKRSAQEPGLRVHRQQSRCDLPDIRRNDHDIPAAVEYVEGLCFWHCDMLSTVTLAVKEEQSTWGAPASLWVEVKEEQSNMIWTWLPNPHFGISRRLRLRPPSRILM
jgi:hypothetical protein